MSASPEDATLGTIANLLRAAKRIVILAHVRPDGDAVGSQIALGSSLLALGKDVEIVNEDGCPPSLDFLSGSELVQQATGDRIVADLVVALDTANRQRLGANCLASLEGSGARWVNIDHHVSNERYGDIVHVDSAAPATGQILFELLLAGDLPLTDAARDALFVAISTDTGAFKYPATTARTYEIGAELLRAGADCGRLSSLTYERYPFRRIELLRELLKVLQLTCKGRVAHWVLDHATKEELKIQPDDSDSLIDIMRSIDGVQVAIFFEELKGGTLRVSMRSKSREVDVCRICADFGGGGHPLASGARIAGDTAGSVDKVLQRVHESIEHGER